MSYKRTEEIKLKQSIKMKEITQSYDWESIVSKRKQTLEKNNIKVGRNKGEGKPKSGWFKTCKMCANQLWVTKSNHNKRFYCSRTCMHSDEEYKQKLKQVDKSYMQTEEYKNTKRNPNMTAYRKYHNKVRRITEQNYIDNVDKINPMGYKRTLCGVKDGWQLDHIKSIKQCYVEGITEEVAGSVENLQMIEWKDNLSKRSFVKIDK